MIKFNFLRGLDSEVLASYGLREESKKNKLRIERTVPKSKPVINRISFVLT